MMKTMPNNKSGKRILMIHEVAIPPCCPVSKNPQPGSKIIICYRAKEQVLEVNDLYVYIHSFQGGKRGTSGEIEVRDMEEMIQRIANDCAQAVGVFVKVYAHLHLLPKQQMVVMARGYHQSEPGKEENI